jgi:hypothetical protein
VLEFLARAIRQEKETKGTQTENEENKDSQDSTRKLLDQQSSTI